MVPRTFVVRETQPGDRRHVDAGSRAGRRASSSRSSPGQFVMVYVFGDRRGADLRERAAARAHRAARSERSARAICASEPGRRARHPRPVRHACGRSRSARAQTSSSSRAASAWRRSGRSSTTPSNERGAYGEVAVLYGARTPADLLYGAELERWRRDGLRRHDGRRCRAGVDGEGRVRTEATPRRPLRRRARRSPSSAGRRS